MAAALHALLPSGNPNPNVSGSLPVLRRLPPTFSCAGRCAIAVGPKGTTAAVSLHGSLLRRCLVESCVRRDLGRVVAFASPAEDSVSPSDESVRSDIELESEKNVHEPEKHEAEEAWGQVLESFKEQALKMQSLSQEAYEVYSTKAFVILEETSKTLKIQADKASRDIAEIAKEIGEEGTEYISSATKNPPDSLKDIVEIFSSPTTEFSEISKLNDFHLGIPYGAFLAVGGFTSFMFMGSTSAIRFGVILGGILLALSVSSLKAWKEGKTSSLLLKGQTGIAAIIFIREWRLLLQRRSLPTFLMTLISGAMLVFYVYRIIVYRRSKGQSLEHEPED